VVALLPDGQITSLYRKLCQASPAKILASVYRKYVAVFARPASDEGRTRRHERGARDATDAAGGARRAQAAAYGEGRRVVLTSGVNLRLFKMKESPAGRGFLRFPR